MKKKLYLGLKLFLLIALIVNFGFQQKEKIESNQTFQLSNYLIKKDGNWMYFKSGLKIPLSDFFEKVKSYLGLSNDFGILIEKSDTDELGMIHYLLRLTSKRIVIDDAWYTAHYSKNGELLEFEGTFTGKIPEITVPQFSKDNAISIAKQAYSTSYIMSLENLQILQKDIESASEDNNRINFDLVYYKPDQQNYLLAYKVKVATTLGMPMQEFYINTQNGEIIKSYPIIFKVENTVNTKYNGSKSFQTTWRGSGYNYYYLLDLSKATSIETRNSYFQDGWPHCYPHGFGGLDVVSNGTLTTWACDDYYNAASAHWAVQESYNVFLNHFGRTYGTFTQSGGEMRVENNYYWRMYQYGQNWYYRPLSTYYYPDGNFDYIHAGNIYGTDGYDVGLDVLGHEFTHGCMYRSRSINIQTGCEAGALMESLADIFGEVIEYFTLGSNDWVFGTNDKPRYRRDFVDPESDSVFYQPDFSASCSPSIIQEYFDTLAPSVWHGNNWYYPQDGTYNYINCSVQNHWFYLLAEGGSQNGVTVTGIGIEKAAAITYHNLAYYFTNSYAFSDMRNASISSAECIYGVCTNEVIQVKNAWAAVGVGNAGAPCIEAYILGPKYICSGETGTWSAFAGGGTGNYTYTWTINSSFWSNDASWDFAFDNEEATHFIIDLSVTDGNLSDEDEIDLLVYPCEGSKSSNNNQLSLNVYPNPATTSTTIVIDDNEIPSGSEKVYDISINDYYGKVLLRKKISDKKLTIDASGFLDGIYTIVVNSEGKKGSIQLVVKK
jgi:Zn-dependent metalloprotease